MIAAPIGNLGDITLRALSILREVGAIAAEDTRVARRLLSAHGARGKRVICARAHAENRAARAVVAAAMADGCAYLCDAGTPAISDPGRAAGGGGARGRRRRAPRARAVGFDGGVVGGGDLAQ